MYKKKRRICVAWLLGMMLLLCACGNLETGKDQGEVAENDKIQIGMSFDFRLNGKGVGSGSECPECER